MDVILRNRRIELDEPWRVFEVTAGEPIEFDAIDWFQFTQAPAEEGFSHDADRKIYITMRGRYVLRVGTDDGAVFDFTCEVV